MTTTFTLDRQNSLPALTLTWIETPPLLACWHCASTLATVLQERAILDARLGYPTEGACCDGEAGNACPQCRGENLEYGTYDFGVERETGYSDSGECYHCRDCGATGDVDDIDPVLVVLPQLMRKPMTPARVSTALLGLE